MKSPLAYATIHSLVLMLATVGCGSDDSAGSGGGTAGSGGGTAGSGGGTAGSGGGTAGSGGGTAGSAGTAGSGGGTAGSAGTAGTGGGTAGMGGGAPSDHTESMSGVMHKPGKEDALANCTACHGSDLKGGGDAPSCYTCHNSQDHTINRGGAMHNTGAGTTCSACHGPNNGGGLGPACTTCH